MKFFVFFVLLAAIVGLLVNSVIQYRAATGTVADRLAAAWKGSLTIFVLGWGALLTFSVQLLDLLTQITGDPQFAGLADSVKSVIPPQYQPFIPPAIMAVGIAARLAHNPPGK